MTCLRDRSKMESDANSCEPGFMRSCDLMINPEQTENWLNDYIEKQASLLSTLPVDQVADLITLLRETYKADKQIFVFGNGGNAANASHFATDLGKGASDALKKRFRVVSLNDNAAWVTALGNDYAYEDVFVRQLENYANEGDMILSSSVSGSSPNLMRAFEWAKEKGIATAAVVGERGGRLVELADQAVILPDGHYGRVEDMQMTIYHMLCYAFMESIPTEQEAA